MTRAVRLVVGLALGLATAACDPGDAFGPAQFAPSLPPAAGLRAGEDGSLLLWTGTPCRRVTRVVVTFVGTDGARTPLVLVAPAPGIAVEHLDLGDLPHDLTVQTSLPDGYDWRTSKEVRFHLYGASPSWESRTAVESVVSGSAVHPATSYLFGKLGWKDEAAVAEDNGSTFLTICTPDPAKG